LQIFFWIPILCPTCDWGIPRQRITPSVSVLSIVFGKAAINGYTDDSSLQKKFLSPFPLSCQGAQSLLHPFSYYKLSRSFQKPKARAYNTSIKPRSPDCPQCHLWWPRLSLFARDSKRLSVWDRTSQVRLYFLFKHLDKCVHQETGLVGSNLDAFDCGVRATWSWVDIREEREPSIFFVLTWCLAVYDVTFS